MKSFKRIIASLALTLGLVFANVTGASAVTRYWQLEMFEPTASTSNRTINIEYKVLSTVSTDTFEVKLFQNDAQLGTQTASSPHGGGNSGVFNVSIPATGTYTYKVTAKNNADSSTDEKSRTVQVVDGPSPTVTTVFVDNGTPAGGATAQTAGATGAGTTATTGAVAGAETGTVSDEAAKDDKSPVKNTASTNKNDYTLPAILVVAAIMAFGYYWYWIRPKTDIK